MAEDSLPMPSPIPKSIYMLSFESPTYFAELAEKAPRPNRTPEYDRIVPSWNIRTEQDEYLEKMQQKLQAAQNRRMDPKAPVAEVEEAAYQPDEEEFEPRAKPEERLPVPAAPDLEETPLIPGTPETQIHSQPKMWRVRFQEQGEANVGKRNKTNIEEHEEVRTEQTPLMRYPMILRDEDEDAEASKCCCLIS